MWAADKPEAGGLGRVPTVIFANWREMLNLEKLPERVRAGYGLAIGG
jgi:hypothetical protein